nr:MAG TPA: hypothetical protein [Caudoviricetes sp.]
MKYSKEVFVKAILHGCADSYFIDNNGKVRTRTATVACNRVIVRDGLSRTKYSIPGFMYTLARIMGVPPTYDSVVHGLDTYANVLAEGR